MLSVERVLYLVHPIGFLTKHNTLRHTHMILHAFPLYCQYIVDSVYKSIIIRYNPGHLNELKACFGILIDF